MFTACFRWLCSIKLSRLALVVLGVVAVFGAQAALAQTNFGLNEFGNATNLGTTANVIGTIAKVINIILGFLGVIAVALILYAGYLWMTAAGNEEKITKAKKILAGGVIGLIIILASFAIASFVVSQLGKATGYKVGGGGGGCDFCDPGLGAFKVTGVHPRESATNVKLCSVVQAAFNEDVDPASVNSGTVIVQKEAEPQLAGTYSTSANALAFRHADFAINSHYVVTLKEGLQNLPVPPDPVKNLHEEKLWSFITGTETDTDLPRVARYNPSGADACLNPAIQAVFTEPMAATTLKFDNIKLLRPDNTEVPLRGLTVSSGFTTVTVYPAQPLASFTNYRVVLKTGKVDGDTGIRDACWNPLDGNANHVADNTPADDFGWAFTTGEQVNCKPEINPPLAPTSGFYGDTVLAHGRNLGIGECTASVNGMLASAACSLTQATFAVPEAPLPPKDAKVRVQVGREASNELTFSIQSPYLRSVAPDRGPVGQFVTLRGANFGDEVGKVTFDDQVAVLACSEGDQWTDGQVVVKVPNVAVRAQPYKVRLYGLVAPTKPSNARDFVVNTEQPTAGLCSVIPACKDDATQVVAVSLKGARLGTSGQVKVGPVNITSADWHENQINNAGPLQANQPPRGSYDVTVVPTSGKPSNPLDFNVPCAPGPAAPHVVDSRSCSRETQSPSPHPSAYACLNSVLAVRFDRIMDIATLPGLTVMGCNTSDDPEPNVEQCTSKIVLAAAEFLYNSSNQVIGYKIPPSDSFDSNRWYQATVAGAVRSLPVPPYPGAVMGAPYTWYFHVRNSAEPCLVSSISVTPSSAYIRATSSDDPPPPPSTTQAILTASGQGQNCNILGDVTYAWTSGNAANLPIVKINPLTTQATVQAENKPKVQPTPITAQVNATTVKDDSLITVDPLSCSTHEDCTACGGSTSRCDHGLCQPALDDATPIDPDNGAIGTWVAINGCYFGTQRGTVKYGGGIPGLWPDPALCFGGSTWNNFHILSEVPPGTQVPCKAPGCSLTVIRHPSNPGNVTTPAYTVNNVERPGLCSVVPNRTTEASRGTAAFTLSGNKFGELQGASTVEHLSFDSEVRTAAQVSTWGDNEIGAITAAAAPVSPNSHDIEKVRVVRGGIASAALDYDIIPGTASEQGDPYINKLDPNNGPVAQWVTLSGGNFGAAPGEVTFAGPNNTRLPAALLPPQCGAAIVWSDTEITTKVPAATVTGLVQVKTQAGKITKPDNVKSKTYTLNVNPLTPGLCLLDPAHVGAPPLPSLPTNVSLIGEGFGDTQGENFVRFSNLTQARIQIFKWTDQQIIVTDVPTITTTGDVAAVKKVGSLERESNSKKFTVDATVPALPRISSVEPANGSTTLCRNPKIQVTFAPSAPGNAITNEQFWLTWQGICDQPEEKKIDDQASARSWLAHFWSRLVSVVYGANTTPPVTTGCRVMGSVRYVSPNTFRYSLPAPLRTGKQYQVDIVSPKVASATGVPCSTVGACRWSFNVDNAATVCQLARVDITPPSWTFTTLADPPKQFDADAKSAGGESLDATFAWSVDSTTLLTLGAATGDSTTVAQRGQNGEGALNVIASGGSYNPGTVTGSASISVFLCEVPWQFTDDPYFRMRYCRSQSYSLGTGVVHTVSNSQTLNGVRTKFRTELKVGDSLRLGAQVRLVTTITNDTELTLSSAIDIPADTSFMFAHTLPNLLGPALGHTGGDLAQEYFFKVEGTTAEAVGLRAYRNPNNLSLRAWYDSRPDIRQGNPQATKVDGYPALKDGQSLYVAAVREPPQTNTYIYVLSYTQGASAPVVTVFNELVKSWTFNLGLPPSDEIKLQRDLKRLGDLGEIKQLLDVYGRNHGAYPDLPAGSFMVGRSTSAWPSWQATLGNALGRALPIDPLNGFKDCPTDPPGYDPTTCWNANTKDFQCPNGSHVYQYTVGDGAHRTFSLNAGLEYLASGNTCTNAPPFTGNLDDN